MRTILTITIVAILSSQAAAQCGLIRCLLEKRLSNLEHRENRLRDLLDPPIPTPGPGSYSIDYQYKATGPGYQMTPAATYSVPVPAPVHTFQVPTPAPVQAVPTPATSYYGSLGSQVATYAPGYRTEQVVAGGTPSVVQNVETITTPPPTHRIITEQGPSTVTRQSYGSQGTALVPQGFHSVLVQPPTTSQVFSYGTTP